MPIFYLGNVHSQQNALLSSPYLIKKCPVSQKHCSDAIFSNLVFKSPAVKPIFCQKNVNSVKTTLYYGPKKSMRCYFCSDISAKISALMPIFCPKNDRFLKKTRCSHAHILYKKRKFSKNHDALTPYCTKLIILSKTLCSYVVFFKFFMKNPWLPFPYLVKKVHSVNIKIILWAKKVNRMPVFSDFTWKNQCCYAHILSTKRPFSKNTLVSCPYFVKNINSPKHSVLISFFSNLPWKSSAVIPIFGQKNVNSVKTTPYYGPKK